MKILHTVEFYSPSVGGAQEVVKQLSEHLVELGHNVTVATTKLPDRQSKNINGVKIVEFDVGGNEVRGYTGKDVKKYQEFLIKSKFDVIMNYAAQQWTTDLAFEVIDKLKARKILVPCGFSGLYEPAYKDYFINLPKILKQYDATVYLSHNYRDINFARSHKLKNIHFIPNGADEREFLKLDNLESRDFRKKFNIKVSDTLILNVSNHTGTKGHKETIEVFKKARIKNSVLMIVGGTDINSGCYKSCSSSAKRYNNFTKYFSNSDKRIIVTSLSRYDTLRAYNAADIFLFLSNIECSPLVLFEAMASSTPFLASAAGNSKEISQWSKAGLTFKCQMTKNGFTTIDTLKYAEELTKLIESPIKLRKMGVQGYKSWKSRFTWAKIAKLYERLYAKSKIL